MPTRARRPTAGPDPAARERIARHGFVDRPARTVVAAVAHTTAVQSQDSAAGRLGVRSRAQGVTDADVRAATDVDRTVVRSWLMRATIHLVAADDVRWLTTLIGPNIARRFAKRWKDIGLTSRYLERTAAALPEILRDGPQPISVISPALAERGLPVEFDDPQAGVHVMLHASSLGLLCRGPERGREQSYALLDQWLPDAPAGPQGDDALAELARRYFTAFGPATAADFTAWSGLPSGHAIRLIRDELTETRLNGRVAFAHQDPNGVAVDANGSTPSVRLLAAYDNYLVGYRYRDEIVDEAHKAAVYVGGVIKPTLLIDGRVAGIWKLTRSRPTAMVTVTPFVPLRPAVRRAVADEVHDISRFLEIDVALQFD